MYEVVLSKSFKKELEKQINHNRKLHGQVEKTLLLLNTNVNSRSLRLHKLSGMEYWSVSVNESYRIKIKIEDNYIYCLKFGTHNEVY
ncbi:MAG: hypothetical protein ACD_13C00010G0055 [uncultured bacterium]|nr:MAG: hypothetical protein ACD_13C00010G0055 [uncultured bacterium]KKR53546.1 MAG: hypothetical protein UT88_C0008G0003 [Candidatus Woesebacteria bacterium GW2011_GWD2_40_19]HAU65022.1 plasmid stabilization protein [Candidatus Woesebacteria bacterium]HCC08781.1 plasmid stabilization protein [Candidatus Woesebacteria bacterium]